MANIKHFILKKLLVCIWIISPLFSSAQDDPNIGKVENLVNYYQFMLNTIGKSSTPSSEKDIIISESFEKIFRDNEVQIEDDLSLERSAIVNKNVNAYLRDVDFFFRTIRFSFTDVSISKSQNEIGDDFYLVKFISNWEGEDLKGNEVSNSGERFMEVNLDARGELNVVSIYSTKISREEALKNWWSSLDTDWRIFFKNEFRIIEDSVSLEQLEQFSDIDSLNFYGAEWVSDILALSELRKLKYLNLSNTSVKELLPLRFMQNLVYLDISNTGVEDISVVDYFKKIEYLNLSNTQIRDLASIENNGNLRNLDISSTQLFDFTPVSRVEQLWHLNISNTSFNSTQLLSELSELEYLNLDKTYVVGLAGLEGLSRLHTLVVSNTYIKDLTPLSNLRSLVSLTINQTGVDDLSPLSEIKSLRKVYADYTNISEEDALAFMQKRREVLVITNSEGLMKWWQKLSPSWKSALISSENTEITSESLVNLLQKDTLDVSNNNLLNGTPLSKFTRLKWLNISNSGISSLDFATGLKSLVVLKANENPISSISELKDLKFLEKIEVNNTDISSLYPLVSLSQLNFVYANNTNIRSEDAKLLWSKNENVAVIHRSEELSSWWSELNADWKKVFSQYLESSESEESLHRLVQKTSITVIGLNINDLTPLEKFAGLEELNLRSTSLMDLSGLVIHKNLKKLECSGSPFNQLKTISELSNLEELIISNTAVESLDALANMKKLKKLDCSGTQIKNIKELRDLKALVYLDISNTKAWQLQWLLEHPEFEVLICYNSRVNDRKVEEFRQIFPECEITYY